MTKRRLSVSVDSKWIDAGHASVARGRAKTLSAWVNDALRVKADHDRRLDALAAFVAAYEAEHGEITDDEIRAASRSATARAIEVRRVDARGAPGGAGTTHDLATSRALWNRNGLDLRSDEVLAQIMDRGTMDDWRALYELASADSALAARMVALTSRAAMTMPGFWRAALESLGAAVDHDAPVVRHADVGT